MRARLSLALALGAVTTPRLAHADEAAPPPAATVDLTLPTADSPWLDQGALRWAPDAPRRRDHRLAAGLGLGGLYVGFGTWAYFAWYYNKPALPEFTWAGDGYFGENTYAGGADKLGHAWATYALARGGSEVLQYGGFSPRAASVISSSLSMALFTFVEVKDGFYYQFSPGDLIGDALGAGLAVAMDTWPRLDELVDFRVEYFPSAEYRRDLSNGDINIAEDYSGQRYLLALHLGAFEGVRRLPGGRLASALDAVVGFESNKYKPDPDDPAAIREQHLFVGVALNLQGVFDELLTGRNETARKITHGLFEVMAPPYGSAAVLGTSRSPDR